MGGWKNVSMVVIVWLCSYSKESLKNYVHYQFNFQEMLKGEVGIKPGKL